MASLLRDEIVDPAPFALDTSVAVSDASSDWNMSDQDGIGSSPVSR